MGSLTMSASGLTELTKDEGSVDGLYDDPSGYASFGVRQLVHSDKASGFLLAAAKANTTWNGKLGTAYTTVKYVPRTAVSWADWADFKTKATDLAIETLAKK